jgi:hypothetical protein
MHWWWVDTEQIALSARCACIGSGKRRILTAHTQTDSRTPANIGQGLPRGQIRCLSIERTFNKFYGIICRPPEITGGAGSRNQRMGAALFRVKLN